MTRLKIEISVPESHTVVVIEALHAAGAGRVGKYTRCSSIWKVSGNWQALPGTQPYDGEVGVVQHSEECRIESVCDADQAGAVQQAVRDARPYEQAAIHFLPLCEP
ncbi:hypothetical protein [Streptomyces fradiae]|uniref:hypothetical protein n=1 Tax=Streptomyces fradiae TaxID=1906 RepID=UPI003985DA3C